MITISYYDGSKVTFKVVTDEGETKHVTIDSSELSSQTLKHISDVLYTSVNMINLFVGNAIQREENQETVMAKENAKTKAAVRKGLH